MTNQPYVFTNDDPLNAADPLGLEANKALIKYDAAVAKKCDGHPDANGCRGINVVGDVGTFLKNNVGKIGSAVAVAGLFVPGIDLVEVAAFTGVGLASRIAQRSINDGSSPFSSANLSSNAVDSLVSVGGLGLLSAPIIAAEGAIPSLSTLSGVLLRARLGLPDIFEYFVDQLDDNGR